MLFLFLVDGSRADIHPWSAAGPLGALIVAESPKAALEEMRCTYFTVSEPNGSGIQENAQVFHFAPIPGLTIRVVDLGPAPTGAKPGVLLSGSLHQLGVDLQQNVPRKVTVCDVSNCRGERFGASFDDAPGDVVQGDTQEQAVGKLLMRNRDAINVDITFEG